MSRTRTWLLFLVFVISSLQLPGCATRTGIVIPGPQTITLSTGVKITINDFTKEEGGFIAKALETVPKKVQESITGINAKCDGLSFSEPAHCHWNMTICTRMRSYDTICEYLWHEVGHAYNMKLGIGGLFQREWENVAGRVYGSWLTDKNFFPTNGVLERHGIRNSMEDIACWVKAVYACYNNERHPFDACFRGEPRYLMKLNLLLQYGFITKEQYDKARSFMP